MSKKFSSEEVSDMLEKAIGKSFSNDNLENNDNDKTTSAIENLTKQVSALTDFIAKNVKIEKPKTTEELLSENNEKMLEMMKSMVEKAIGKKIDEEDSNIPSNKDELKNLIGSVVKEMIDKEVDKTDKKGVKKKDFIDDVIDSIVDKSSISDEDDEDDEDDNDDKKARVYTCEKSSNDDNHRELTQKEIDARQDLDDWVGKNMETIVKKTIGK